MVSNHEVEAGVISRLFQVERYFLSHRLLNPDQGRTRQLRLELRRRILRLHEVMLDMMAEFEEPEGRDHLMNVDNQVMPEQDPAHDEEVDFQIMREEVPVDPDMMWDANGAVCMRCGFEWDGNAQHICD